MPSRQTVYFTGPRRIEVREEALPAPATGRMLVKTHLSAISTGTEMLVYRGQFPHGMAVDESIPALKKKFAYPLCYGYAAVGHVAELGKGVSEDWLGRAVFSFQPHTSHFYASPETVTLLPAGFSLEAAAFLPNTETAVNLAQDGAPILGENVLVFGQGVIGLLTAALLAEFPLESLVTVDPIACRRSASLALGVTASLDPAAAGFKDRLSALLPLGADLSYELSGAPSALNEAIAATRFSGRVVIGSWYGEKPVQVELGGAFHRSRVRLLSSQVSSLAPELAGRWDKSRRFETAWRALERIRPEKWITHRFPCERAAEAYALLDESPSETIQVLLDY
ncbi:MAG TPA: zinc-binding alcohol dehydrogenase [Anaerolineales bacterium]|nr:zinc-binding alcohol dehydrogenase [Anaerolineales bacterium]